MNGVTKYLGWLPGNAVEVVTKTPWVFIVAAVLGFTWVWFYAWYVSIFEEWPRSKKLRNAALLTAIISALLLTTPVSLPLWYASNPEGAAMVLVVLGFVTGFWGLILVIRRAVMLKRLRQSPPPEPSGIHGTADLATPEMLTAAGLTGAKWGEGIRLGENNVGDIIRYNGENSVTIVGPPGTGKMTTMAAALTVEFGGSMVILDPKGELLAITRRARDKMGRVIVLCPFKEGLPPELAHYADETDSYNPLDLLDPKAESFQMNCDTLAEILIAPDTSGESKESGFFTGNAQALVSGVIMQLVLNQPDRANLAEVASIVCSDKIFSFAADAMQTGDQFVMDRLSTFGSKEAPKLQGGIGDILRTAREQLKWISNLAMARVLQTPKNPWRFEGLKSARATVFVVLPAKYQGSARRFFRLLLGAAVAELQSSPKGTYPVLCLADEFPMLGRVQIFETVFAEGRGHGFKVIPIIQDIGQLKKLYGHDGYRTFLSGSEIQIFLPPRDFETAQEISRLSGQKTVVTRSQSYSDVTGMAPSESVGYGETGRPVLDPHEVLALKPDEFLMVAPGLVKDIVLGVRPPYWEYKDVLALCDPNPYNPKTPEGFVTIECPHCKWPWEMGRTTVRRIVGLRVGCPKCKKKWELKELPASAGAIAKPAAV